MKAAFSPGIKIHPGFWDSLNQLGITMHDIAEEANVIPSSIHESEVTQEQYFSIWQAYSSLVGDTAEAMMPSGQMPQYCMTKSMLLSLSKTLSKLTAGTEVTVNTILPGPTLSENVQSIIESIYVDELLDFEAKEIHFMKKNLPQSELQRFIRPAEIGKLVAFVCSPFASSFRGSPIRMDGGMVPTLF
ncbi:hypothetical protein GCM10008014_19490 [Paenibacillus silvae]|uniref:SDR family NAD(P)-dependent oxidoreductase n=1 Tax=Paenibacillus silvae TaxID=1325358 RepID=A0ABQ1Z9C1_9BACL|nr:hypothetical protein GCM10008014_19490 [Paenibacillus silvae]